MEIRETTEQDDDIFVRHCLATWATLGWPEERFFPDAAERIRQGIQDIRQRHPMGGFLAMDGEEVVGSIIYYLHYLPYPRVVRPAYFDLAYVCGMFVEPAYRRQGIARRLMEHTANHLRSLGSTSIVLHSMPNARGFYERLDFAPASELRLAL
jgi:ribosomal protein S18 acetylase RimI-like enzyme